MFSTCVFVLEEMSNVAAALKLHFFPRVWNTFKHRERRASFRREKNTRRERKRERAFYITVLDRAHKIDTRSGKERVVLVPIAFRGNQSNGSNHIEKSKRSHIHTHTHKVIMATKVQRIMTQPINLIFRFLQTKSRVQIWLYEHAANGDVLEGQIVGFDEYMNLVLNDCEEVKRVGGATQRTSVGRVLLKGDSVTMMVKVDK